MEYKVIFHIDERLRWPMLLGNVENLLAEAVSTKECSQMTVEVVANGDAVLEYAPKRASCGFASAMAALHQKGVTFAACRNAIKGNSLTEAELEDFVVTVPAGVMELVRRQAQGYSYIRP